MNRKNQRNRRQNRRNKRNKIKNKKKLPEREDKIKKIEEIKDEIKEIKEIGYKVKKLDLNSKVQNKAINTISNKMLKLKFEKNNLVKSKQLNKLHSYN